MTSELSRELQAFEAEAERIFAGSDPHFQRSACRYAAAAALQRAAQRRRRDRQKALLMLAVVSSYVLLAIYQAGGAAALKDFGLGVVSGLTLWGVGWAITAVWNWARRADR